MTLPSSPATPASPSRNAEMAGFADALAGQYDLECEIGRGGMGVVYRAHDLRLDRLVAIKTLPRAIADDPGVRERFLREARTVARLSHPNIVPIHRADEIGGYVFFVMGLVNGESLAQRSAARGPLPAREAVDILRDVADALAYAHAHQVIHRDVKAENILIDSGPSGRAMVTDFGIARVAEAPALTATGQVLGTVHYLSPEQVSGDTVDARSDIYSLGIVGFFALAGRFPFTNPLASAVLVSHITKLPPTLHSVAPSVPTELASIIDRCLLKDPDARYQRCDDLVSEFTVLQQTLRNTSARAAEIARAPLISETEGHRILGRAADLQAQTAQNALPVLTPMERDAARDAARTSGYNAIELREAAVEAGIPSVAIDRAMQEHGLGVKSPRPGSLVDQSPASHPVLGERTRLEMETVIDGEMPTADFDLLVDIIRRSAGEAGRLETVGRSFSWQSDPAKGNLNVSILPRAGRTRIRASESLRAAATGIFGGLMGPLAGGGIPVWMGIGMKIHQPVAAVVGWAATVLGGYIAARIALGWHGRKRETAMRELIEQIAAQVRESVGEKSGSEPRL